MRINWVKISDFRNLKNFQINFDFKNQIYALAGPNGSGKSNLFDCLIKSVTNKRQKNIKLDPKPEAILYYYSGENRIIMNYAKRTQNRLINSLALESNKKKWGTESIPLSRLLCFDNNSLNLIITLLHLYHPEFIKKYFPNEFNFDFFRIQLKKPKIKEDLKKFKEEEEDFDIYGNSWKLKGQVLDYFNLLRDLAKDSSEDLGYKQTIQYYNGKLQLLISLKQISKLKSFFKDAFTFLKLIEMLDSSGLFREISFNLIFDESKIISPNRLSEGQLQYLFVLGIIKICPNEDFLILLDEPETHLNPQWKLDYINELKSLLKEKDKIQVLINTHDPLLIGNLKKEEVYVFNNNQNPFHPEMDPKGMGINGILMSDIFGLPSVIDQETDEVLTRRRGLAIKKQKEKLSPEEEMELSKLNDQLDNFKYLNITDDPLYNKFLDLLSEKTDLPTFTADKIKKINFDEISKKINNEK